MLSSLSDTFSAFSPLKMARAAERRLSANAEKIAEFILGQQQSDSASDTSAADAVTAAAPASKPAAVTAAAPASKPVTKGTKREASPRVKAEVQRDLPFRSKRRKQGFYAEGNLVSLAWRGEGTVGDPIEI